MMHGNAVRATEPSDYSMPSRARVTAESLREQVRALAPELDSDSGTFRAAVLLLAALRVGQNIDRLTRLTRYDRAFVAKCARRLVDNGVWQQGRTVSDWCRDDGTNTAFWNDVAVAEGRLCRRINDEGEIEWAEAGVWRKHYDFVTPRPHAEPANLYHASPLPVRDEAGRTGVDRAIESPRRRMPWMRDRNLLPRIRVFAHRRSKQLHEPVHDVPEATRTRAAVPELFPGTMWLS